VAEVHGAVEGIDDPLERALAAAALPAIWLTISPASLPTIACSGNAARSVAIIAFSASVSALKTMWA
jgi:hypothetical protein